MSEFDRTKWDAKYTDPNFAPREPSSVLMSLARFLPAHGKALEVAGGAGRNAIWLAQQGLDVTIADVSSVGLAQAAARAGGVSGVSLERLASLSPAIGAPERRHNSSVSIRRTAIFRGHDASQDPSGASP